jgi:hypothetical protein
LTNILLVRSNGAQNNPEGECGIIRLRIAEQLKMNIEHRTSNVERRIGRRNLMAEGIGHGAVIFASGFSLLATG